MSLPTQERELICAPEALRLIKAIRFRMEQASPDKKLFWLDLFRQLVQLTKRDYLVPDHLLAREWEALANMPPIRPV